MSREREPRRVRRHATIPLNFLEPPFSTLRRTDDEGEVRTSHYRGKPPVLVPARPSVPSSEPRGVGGGGRRSDPRSCRRGPVVLTKMCVRAVLEDTPRRQSPGTREACSSATTTFEAPLKAPNGAGEGHAVGSYEDPSCRRLAKYRPHRPRRTVAAVYGGWVRSASLRVTTAVGLVSTAVPSTDRAAFVQQHVVSGPFLAMLMAAVGAGDSFASFHPLACLRTEDYKRGTRETSWTRHPSSVSRRGRPLWGSGSPRPG
jgi:hypothetical protein